MCLQLYMQSTSDPDSTRHDITPAVFTRDGHIVNLGVGLDPGVAMEFSSIEAIIDISSACTSTVEPIQTGTNKLILEVALGNQLAMQGLVDAYPENNVWSKDIQVNCQQSE